MDDLSHLRARAASAATRPSGTCGTCARRGSRPLSRTTIGSPCSSPSRRSRAARRSPARAASATFWRGSRRAASPSAGRSPRAPGRAAQSALRGSPSSSATGRHASRPATPPGLRRPSAGCASQIEERSPWDPASGAVRVAETLEALAVEVDRCRRTALSLGVLGLALADEPGAWPAFAPRAPRSFTR